MSIETIERTVTTKEQKVVVDGSFRNIRVMVPQLVASVDAGYVKQAAILCNNPQQCQLIIDEFLRKSTQNNPVKYFVSRRNLDWENGASIKFFVVNEPDRLCGYLFELLVVLDYSSNKDSQAVEYALLGLRLGDALLYDLGGI